MSSLPPTLTLLVALAAAACPLARAAESSLSDYISHAPFAMPTVREAHFPDARFPITDYGAQSDARSFSTKAFDAAIRACSEAGGGHVIVPAGLWLTGPIVLLSNVDLHLETGALVQITSDHTQFPMVPRADRGYVAASCISATDQTNVAITGCGIVDGAGDTWRPVRREKQTDAQWQRLLRKGGVTSNEGANWWPTKEAMEGEDYLAELAKRTKHPSAEESLPARDFRRSPLVSFTRCAVVLVDGPTLRNSPSGVLVPSDCTDVIFRNTTVFNEWWAQNGDGMDIGPCRNVIVYRCTLSTGDDAICMKSGGKNPWKGEPGLNHVIVADCTVYHGHGGFVVGGSTEAGIEDLWATHCTFVGTDTGIRVKSGLGHGGLVRGVHVDHIVMRDIVNEAIVFNSFYDNTPVSAATKKQALTRDPSKTPEFKDFDLSDIVCLGAGTAISITGLKQMPIHDIQITRSRLTADKGLRARDAANITLRQVLIETSDPTPSVESDCNNMVLIK